NAGVIVAGGTPAPQPTPLPAPQLAQQVAPQPQVISVPVVVDFAPLTELPADDLGGGPSTTLMHMSLTDASNCTIRIAAEDPTTQALYTVTRMRDLEAEARIGAMTATTHAVHARASLTANLVGLGADVNAREQRRLAAIELKAHQARLASLEAGVAIQRRERADNAAAAANLEASLQISSERQRQFELEYAKAEAQAQLAFTTRTRLINGWVAAGADLQRRQRLVQLEKQRVIWAFQVRSSWQQSLIRMGANPDRRAELRLQLERERAQRAGARAQASMEATIKAQAEYDARLQLALNVQTRLTAQLVGLGAVVRPPMPAPLDDFRGEAPSPEFTWVGGRWVWANLQWTWENGGWIDRHTGFSLAATVNNDPRPVVGGSVEGNVSGSISIPTIPTIPTGPVVIDHRGVSVSVPISVPVVIDHRGSAPAPATAPVRPVPPPPPAPTKPKAATV
ncbi:MAG TPA: hypothetical protein PLF40_31485, partial [Kofleriaceae bacterium]|nr:hypothetical protein [Kofleriaceae bacterium]